LESLKVKLTLLLTNQPHALLEVRNAILVDNAPKLCAARDDLDNDLRGRRDPEAFFDGNDALLDGGEELAEALVVAADGDWNDGIDAVELLLEDGDSFGE